MDDPVVSLEKTVADQENGLRTPRSSISPTDEMEQATSKKPGRQGRRATIKDVAAKAGVSFMTVSRAIKATLDTDIHLTMREGSVGNRYWTSYLTEDYVKFNADYTT